MAGPAPKTDKWTALENRHKPSGLHLLVSGIVQGNASALPRLAEAPHQGTNPKILVLDLSLETGGGAGGSGQVWNPVGYHKVVKKDQYGGVDIHWGGKSIATCKVLDDAEHYQHLVELTQAANAKFAKKPKPPATPKPKTAAPSKGKAPASAKPSAKGKTAASSKKAAASSKRKTAAATKRKSATAPKPKRGTVKRKTASSAQRKTARGSTSGRRRAGTSGTKKRR